MMSHKHNHSCGCLEEYRLNTNKACRILPRWLFCILFILGSFYLLRPVMVRQLTNRAGTYISYPLYDEAIREYKKAIFLDSHNSDLYASIAYAYRSKNDFKQSENAYKEAIRLNSLNKAAIFELGMLYFMQGKYEEAIKQFNVVVELVIDDREDAVFGITSYHRPALNMLTESYGKLGREKDRESVLQRIRYFYPEDKKSEVQ